MRHRSSAGLLLLLSLAASTAAENPKRYYEVYSNVDDSGDDPVGVELELILWENSVDATLNIYRSLAAPTSIRLQGSAREDEVSLSAAQGEETLEIRGKRQPKRFQGELVLKRKGDVVRSNLLDLPRKVLKK